MPEIGIEHATDIGQATLSNYARDSDRLQMTFNETNMTPLNDVFTKDKMTLAGGDDIRGYVTLTDTGNAKHVGMWEEDSDNIVNTDSEIIVQWTNATTNMTYNRIELGINVGKGEVAVYDYLNGKRKNMFREFAEELQYYIFLSPTGASDKKHPHGLSCWLPRAADNATGGFTGYAARYNDGSGTEYAAGGITASSTVKPRWASWFADTNGTLGDNLIGLMDSAIIDTSFVPPIVPETIAGETKFSNLRIFTTKAVVMNLTNLLRKTDDLTANLSEHLGTLRYMSVPFVPIKQLATANATLYGTNPVWGVNMDWLHVKVLESNNFVIGKPVQRDNFHNVLKVPLDVSYGYICDNRQRAGFLISQI